MSRKGNCYDNAVMESFWATLKTECFGSYIPETKEQAKIMRVLSSLKRMNMVKIFTIIEKQVYKKVTHFGSQISEDFEVFLRRYPSPFRSGFERGQPQDYAANLQSAA